MQFNVIPKTPFSGGEVLSLFKGYIRHILSPTDRADAHLSTETC